MSLASAAIVLGGVSAVGTLLVAVYTARANQRSGAVDRTQRGMNEYMTRLEGENLRLRDQVQAQDLRSTAQDQRMLELEKRHHECEEARRSLEVKVELLTLRLGNAETKE